MYPTLSDYLEKAREDFKKKKNSPNEEYLELPTKQDKWKKLIKDKLK